MSKFEVICKSIALESSVKPIPAAALAIKILYDRKPKIQEPLAGTKVVRPVGVIKMAISISSGKGF